MDGTYTISIWRGGYSIDNTDATMTMPDGHTEILPPLNDSWKDYPNQYIPNNSKIHIQPGKDPTPTQPNNYDNFYVVINIIDYKNNRVWQSDKVFVPDNGIDIAMPNSLEDSGIKFEDITLYFEPSVIHRNVDKTAFYVYGDGGTIRDLSTGLTSTPKWNSSFSFKNIDTNTDYSDKITTEPKVTFLTNDKGEYCINTVECAFYSVVNNTLNEFPNGWYQFECIISVDTKIDGVKDWYKLVCFFGVGVSSTPDNNAANPDDDYTPYIPPDTQQQKTVINPPNPIDITITGKLLITPVCRCYLNSETSKTITYNYAISNISVDAHGYLLTNVFFEKVKETAKYYLRLMGKNNNKIYEKDITNEPNPGTVDYAWNLATDTVFDGKWQLVAKYNNKEYKLDEQDIKVIRQKYCHTVEVVVKLYDNTGKEVKQIIHPTSGEYDSTKDNKYTVKIEIKDEQGQYIDIPTDKITVNWQQTLIKEDTGKYSFIIENDSNSALGLGDYGIAVYLDKDWCETNGYYNSYNISADNVIINNNKIEKIMYVGGGVSNYDSGTTNLDNTYDKLSGIFINPQLSFDVVQLTQTATNPLNRYTFCYTPFVNSISLNLPTYMDSEKTELIKAIMRALAQPRKIETFQIMTKPDKLPKINQNITLNDCVSSQYRTIPIYGLEISIANKQMQINISNEEKKLMKDYLNALQ